MICAGMQMYGEEAGTKGGLCPFDCPKDDTNNGEAMAFTGSADGTVD